MRTQLLVLTSLLTACNAYSLVGVNERGDASVGGGGSGGSTPTSGTCRLEAPAFCETFDTPSPGGRGGDLDETRWSFARWSHALEYLWVRQPAGTYPERPFPATFCGAPFTGLLPGSDVRSCPGAGVDGSISDQLNEVFDDQAGFAFNSMRIRTPFDFSNRTGIISWDVDAKINPLNLGHGWWIELWITRDPVPMPHDPLDAVSSVPASGVGFAFRFGADCPESETDWRNALETVLVAEGGRITQFIPSWLLEETAARCFRVADGRLNHFQLRISQDRAELWASDFDDPATFTLRTAVSGLGLTFSRGYLHFQHGQDNAGQDGVSSSQTFRWDNLGFDGPPSALPRAYDVQENGEPSAGGVLTGWYLDDAQPRTFTLEGVDPTGALSASLNCNLIASIGTQLEYSFNGNPPHTFVLPDDGGPADTLRGVSLDVPLDELVSGSNTLELRVPTPLGREGIGNIDLTVETSG